MTGSGSLFKYLINANAHENHRAAGGQQARQMTPLGQTRGSDEAAYAAPYRAVGQKLHVLTASMFEHPEKSSITAIATMIRAKPVRILPRLERPWKISSSFVMFIANFLYFFRVRPGNEKRYCQNSEDAESGYF